MEEPNFQLTPIILYILIAKKITTMHLPSLLSTISLLSMAQAYNLKCFSDSNCKGNAGGVKNLPEKGSSCVNTVGRKSCLLWNHQKNGNAGEGAGPITYVAGKNCPSNIDASTCVIKYVSTGNTCFNIDSSYPSAQFRADYASTSCPL